MKIVTIKNLLQNPSGTQSAYFARRDLIIENLKDRYYKILQTRNIEIKIYKDKGDYYFYLKVPSEKFTEDLMYDIVIQFIPVGGSTQDLTLNNYAINVFSNSPNFMFTYAYVYNQDDILIDFLKKKISKLALTQPPKVKNPLQSYGFEKSVYFSLLYLKEKGLTNKSRLGDAKKLDKDFLIKNIMDCEDKLKKYQLLDKKEKDERKRKKEQEKRKKELEKSKEQAKKRTKVTKTKVSNSKTNNKKFKTKVVKRPTKTTLKRK